MDNQLKKNMGKRIVGTLAIPVIVAAILMIICALGERKMIDTALGFNNFVSYVGIVMITTMALSINSKSGHSDRRDFRPNCSRLRSCCRLCSEKSRG